MAFMALGSLNISMVASRESSSSVEIMVALTLPLTEIWVLMAKFEALSIIFGRLLLA